MPIMTVGTGRALIYSGIQTYDQRVLATGPIAYWPQSETAGVTAHCLVNPLQDGTYNGVTLANDNTGPFGTPAPFFDGANDYCNTFSAALSAVFNGATGSIMIWAKVANVGVWTDGLRRDAIMLRSGGDYYYSYRNVVNNNYTYQGIVGGGAAAVSEGGVAITDWMCQVMTFSDSNNDDLLIGYRDGAAVGIPSAAMNAWGGGALNATWTCIGATNTTPAQVWHGWLGPCAIWNRVLTPAEIAGLYVT